MQEDEISQLQQENQLLREKADLQKEQISLLQKFNDTYQENFHLQQG